MIWRPLAVGGHFSVVLHANSLGVGCRGINVFWFLFAGGAVMWHT